jgi:23S rRNA pseudouridine1911/1915/1917 synthase
MDKKITVTYDQSISLQQSNGCKSVRLDQYLFDQFPEYSRSYFQRLIENNHIQVNSKISKKNSYKLRNLDQVEISFQPIKDFNTDPIQVDFEIIEEQEDFIVINKPAGLVVHNSESNKDEISLVNGLMYKFKNLTKKFDDNQRPGIIHRLDRQTSGIIIVAKDPKSQKALSNLFAQREISKSYLAIVCGHPDPTGEIDVSIGRHPHQRYKMTSMGICPRESKTSYKVIEYYKEHALVEAMPATGRTHQIRVHLASIGYPIMGDSMYGSQSKMINRQALHAWKLSFEHRKTPFSYTCFPPTDIQGALFSLRKNVVKKLSEI